MSTAVQPEIERQQSSSRYITFLLVVFGTALAWSASRPHDYFTWFLEVVPAIIGLAVLGATYNRFRFTPLVYTILLLHAIILMVGGHYTYAEVPLGNWVRDAFHLTRNHYDRLGHFAQGFVPALIAREVLIRKKVVKRGWLYFIVFAICMMVTACYELFEFAVAKATGSASDAFLGSQGDPWDTQWDMMMCFIGCNVALLTMSRWQDKQIRAVEPED